MNAAALARVRFDRDRHHEVQRVTLLARERQRRRENRPTILFGISKRIISLAAAAAGVEVADILSDRRTHAVCHTRWVVAWVIKQHTRHSATEIGRKLGGRDHSTIIHGFNKVRGDLASGGARFGPDIAYVETHLGLR